MASRPFEADYPLDAMRELRELDGPASATTDHLRVDRLAKVEAGTDYAPHD